MSGRRSKMLRRAAERATVGKPERLLASPPRLAARGQLINLPGTTRATLKKLKRALNAAKKGK